MEVIKKQEPGKIQKPIEVLANIDVGEKKESQLIAFRADFENAKRIEVLEKILQRGKTDIIKESLRASYDGFLIRDTLHRLMPAIKKEFRDAKITHGGIGSHKEEDDEEIPFNFSPDASFALVELPEFKKCQSVDKNIKGALDALILELKVEGLKTIKLEITKPIIAADINKMDAILLKELQIIALKNNLELNSSRMGKEIMQFEFKIERMLDLHERYLEKFAKDMKDLHNSLSQIKETSCFKKKEISASSQSN